MTVGLLYPTGNHHLNSKNMQRLFASILYSTSKLRFEDHDSRGDSVEVIFLI